MMPALNSIDLPALLLSSGLRILLIVVLVIVVRRIIQAVQHRLESQIQSRINDKDWVGRVRTLLQVSRGVVDALVLFLALLMILVVLEINIAPLLAGAGIAGLAVSLGAQTLIKDYLGGVLILVENQFKVGDSVLIGRVTGEVERITLRAVYLRDYEGQLHIIPNGEVRILSNLSRDWSRAVVDLAIPYQTNFEQAIQCLQEAAEAVRSDPNLEGALLDKPEVQSWLGLEGGAIKMRITVKTLPGKQQAAATSLRQKALEALRLAGIPNVFSVWEKVS
jgi:small conductance mechanosensitive channel